MAGSRCPLSRFVSAIVATWSLVAIACASTPSSATRPEYRKLFAAVERNDDEKVAEEAEAVLRTNFADLFAHHFARVAYTKLGKSQLADLHRRIGTGLFQSLLASGDGRSPDTAMKVISVEEEYFFLRLRGETVKQQSLRNCAGRPCDVLKTIDARTSEEREWYFDVEAPMVRSERALSGPRPQSSCR